MKKIITIIIISLTIISANAQQIVRTYYDYKKNESTRRSNNEFLRC